MSRRALAAVLFDAHETLIELREPVGETYARFARHQGVDLPAWRIDDAFRRVLTRMPERFDAAAPLEAVGESERAWWRKALRDTFRATDQTVRFEDFDALFEAVYEHYAGAGAWRLREGARAMLSSLRARGLRLGLVSNFDERLSKVLQRLAIIHFFDFVASPSTVGARKPDAALFRAALEGLDVTPEVAAYVGDGTPGDLDGARGAGLLALDASEFETLEALPARLEALATLPPQSANCATEPANPQ